MAFSAFKNLLVKLAGSGIRFPRINADHTTDELTAAAMLAALGGSSCTAQEYTNPAADVTMAAGTTLLYTVGSNFGAVSSSKTVTLPSPASLLAGQRVLIADAGSNLDGASGSFLLTHPTAGLILVMTQPGAWAEFMSDGVTAYYLIGGSVDVLENYFGDRSFGGQVAFNAGATAPSQGVDWAAIGDTELITRGMAAARFKKSFSIIGTNLLYYGSGARPTAGNIASTQPAAQLASGSNHRLLMVVDAPCWAGRTVKIRMIWTNSSTGNLQTPRLACSIRNTALGGSDTDQYNAGSNDTSPFDTTYSATGPTVANALMVTESAAFTIPASATAIGIQVGFEVISSGTAFIAEAQLIDQ